MIFQDEASRAFIATQEIERYKNCYVGNKKKILLDIHKFVQKEIPDYQSITDIFAGSGVVSLFFKLLDKRVISNDLLTSSYIYSEVFVQNNNSHLTPDEIQFLLHNDSSNSLLNRKYVEKAYLNRFTQEEATFLDNYRANIEILFGEINSKRWLAFAAMQLYIINRCFVGGRLNKGQVLAEVKHRLEHQRNKNNAMNFNADYLTLPLFSSASKCEAYNLDIMKFLDLNIHSDILYIDPPYGDSQSDYSFMYSFFEEYIYGDNIDSLPHIKDSTGFFSKKNYEENFKLFLSKLDRYPNWLISYNDKSWATIEKITECVGSFRSNIKVDTIEYKYNYRKKENESSKEYLILARS